MFQVMKFRLRYDASVINARDFYKRNALDKGAIILYNEVIKIGRHESECRLKIFP